MTPGEHALAEAARLETARIYSRTVPEHHNKPGTDWTTLADAIHDGWPNQKLMARFCLDYDAVREARRRHGNRPLTVIPGRVA